MRYISPPNRIKACFCMSGEGEDFDYDEDMNLSEYNKKNSFIEEEVDK